MPDPAEVTNGQPQTFQQIAASIVPGLAAAPVQAAPVADPAPTPAAQPVPIWQTYKFEDEASFASALEAHFAETEKLKEYADIGQRVAPNLSDYEKWQADQAAQKAKADQAAAEAAKPKWNAPQYDQQWASRATWDEASGRFLPNTVADHDAARGLNDYVARKAEIERQMVTDPLDVLRQAGLDAELEKFYSPREKAMAERLEKLEAILNGQQQATVKQQADAFWEKHNPAIYQADATGKLTEDFTPLGNTLKRYVDALEAAKTPPAEQLRLAEEFITAMSPPAAPNGAATPAQKPRAPNGQFAPQPAAPAAKPEPTFMGRVAQRNRLTNGAGRSANRNGAEGTAVDDETDFAAIAEQEMRKVGWTP